MTEPRVFRAGGPCWCSSSRRVRFAIPPGIRGPDVAGVISCRAEGETGPQSVREHGYPDGRAITSSAPRS